jgi:hypothetical protein
MRRTLSVLVVFATALAIGSTGVAQAHRGRHHRIERPVHVEATVQYLDGTSRAMTGDRGEITAIAFDSLTLVRPDAVEVTVGLTDTTCYHVDGLVSTWDRLVVGDSVATLSEQSSTGGLVALSVRAGTPLFLPDQPGCGLFQGAFHADETVTFVDGETAEWARDKGRISGIAPRLIRIERADGAQVVAAVDRHTAVRGVRSYRELNLGEPVWLLSLKVNGDPNDLLALLIRRIR